MGIYINNNHGWINMGNGSQYRFEWHDKGSAGSGSYSCDASSRSEAKRKAVRELARCGRKITEDDLQ